MLVPAVSIFYFSSLTMYRNIILILPHTVVFKGGPSDLGTKILQKYIKIILILPKPFNFRS